MGTGTGSAAQGGGLVAMVLCAGLGTRLRPLTHRLPKPAAPLGGVPLVRWTLALAAGAGARRAVVNVHHLPEAMADAARAAGQALGLPVEVSHEPVIAGTGGALREARALLQGAEELLLLNGDVLFDVDLAAAVQAHRQAGAVATMVLLPMPAGARYNAVGTDAAGAVRRIADEVGPGGPGLRPWHFSGVHVLSGALLDHLPAAPFEADVLRKVYPPFLERGLVHGHVVEGYWNDLGSPDRYLAANRDLLAGRVPRARFAGADPFRAARLVAPGVAAGEGALIAPGARVVGPVLLGPGARVAAGAEVGPEVVLGAGAVVPAGAVARRAVIWEGTALAPGERLEDAIAAGTDRVRASP
ncbi:MAG: NDP-sugar synthase [Anaeromyxobacter sp.]